MDEISEVLRAYLMHFLDEWLKEFLNTTKNVF